MRLYARVVALAMAAVLAVTLVGCNRDVAVKVNGEVIKKTEVEDQLATVKKQYPQMFSGADGKAREADFRNRVVENLINAVLIKQATKDLDVDISEKQVNEQLAELKKGFADEKTFSAALKKYGLTLDKLKEQLRQQMLTQELSKRLMKDIKVTDAEMQKYYSEHKGDFKEAKGTRASHILFTPEPKITEKASITEKAKATAKAEATAKATAEKVLAQVKGGGDFAALAKQYSTDKASAAKGGDLGWPQTPYVPQFQAAIDKLNVGQISGLVKSPYGYHIIKVTAKRPERQKTYDDAKSQIKQILQQQRQAEAYQDFLNKQKKKAKIEYAEGFAPAKTTER